LRLSTPGAPRAPHEAWRRLTISFENFHHRLGAPGSSRGVTLAVLAAAAALAVAVLTPLLYPALAARRELGPLAVDPVRAASLLELRKFPFHEAAVAGGRDALAAAFSLQTKICALGLCAIGAYFAWRGYANPRPRGWGPFFWVAAVSLFFFAPTALPKLSVQRVDYAATAVLGAARGAPRPPAKPRPAVLPLKLEPAAVLATRAGLAALAAAFLSLACHDAAYRLRETLAEFGLLEAQPQSPGPSGATEEVSEEKPRRASRKIGREPETEGDESRFGRRGRPRKAPPDDPRARAFALLGISAGASRLEIEKAFRARIKHAHPDHGGSAEQAAALNDARNLLLSQG